MDFKEELDFYHKILDGINQTRVEQSQTLYKCLLEHFQFPSIECIETGASSSLADGAFGLFLAKMCETHDGVFHSVDLSERVVEASKVMFNRYMPSFNVNHHCLDSVNFLKSYQGSPNLVHLDSWDLDLTNPVPCMLHGWLEFEAIRDKMPPGSIILVDDNYMRGTWVEWNFMRDGNFTGDSTRIDITYDIVGKGALIYHWCKKEETDWDLIGDHYYPSGNRKVIIKKRDNL